MVKWLTRWLMVNRLIAGPPLDLHSFLPLVVGFFRLSDFLSCPIAWGPGVLGQQGIVATCSSQRYKQQIHLRRDIFNRWQEKVPYWQVTVSFFYLIEHERAKKVQGEQVCTISSIWWCLAWGMGYQSACIIVTTYPWIGMPSLYIIHQYSGIQATT